MLRDLLQSVLHISAVLPSVIQLSVILANVIAPRKPRFVLLKIVKKLNFSNRFIECVFIKFLCFPFDLRFATNTLDQGILTEGEGSVRMTSALR
jgi:hypothetical protein